MAAFRRVSFLLLLGVFIFSNVAQAADSETDESVCTKEEGPEKGCSIEGNTDFYGGGVRMGIYFQWVTSWLANNFLPEEISGSLDTNAVFLLALFSTVFTYSVQANHIRVVDVLIIHQLCLGFLFSIMSLWGYRTMYYKTEGPGGRRHFGRFGTHFRLFLMSAITAYGVWFWLRGIDTLPLCNQRKECGGLEMWIFTKMKVKSKVTRNINLVVAAGAAFYYGIMALTALIAGFFYMTRKLRGKKDEWELISRPVGDVSLDKRELTTWYIGLSIFNLFWLIFSIISIEWTLNLNHMNNAIGAGGIRGAGQLIPTLIGLISLTKVLYELACQVFSWMRNKKEGVRPPHEGYDLSSPIGESKTSKGLGLSDGAYSSAAQVDDLENAGSVPTSLHRSKATQRRANRKRSLPHRILLAWLPWLNIFKWSRQSLTPDLIRNSGIFASGGKQHVKGRDPGAGFEVSEVNKMGGAGAQDARQRMGHVRGQSSSTTNGTYDSPSTALLASPSQGLQPGTKGLMADMTDQVDIELSDKRLIGHRRSSSDTLTAGDMGVYEGKGYDDFDA